MAREPKREPAVLRCPHCGHQDIRRSHRLTFRRIMLMPLGFVQYRCISCRRSFLSSTRQGASRLKRSQGPSNRAFDRWLHKKTPALFRRGAVIGLLLLGLLGLFRFLTGEPN